MNRQGLRGQVDRTRESDDTVVILHNISYETLNGYDAMPTAALREQRPVLFVLALGPRREAARLGWFRIESHSKFQVGNRRAARGGVRREGAAKKWGTVHFAPDDIIDSMELIRSALGTVPNFSQPRGGTARVVQRCFGVLVAPCGVAGSTRGVRAPRRGLCSVESGW